MTEAQRDIAASHSTLQACQLHQPSRLHLRSETYDPHDAPTSHHQLYPSLTFIAYMCPV